ncbi:MAG TPA: zf-HC2 domain-containing protein [Anaerolineales bacterium]|nr:zf-HC2 domain-containing protein [Anaerolineales bacterium]
MTTSSFRDVEQLSAYLDGQLSGAEKARLEARLKSDPALAALLDDLRQAQALLRRAPHRRAPHNFTLTPKMAGIRPPVPRVVPALSWASAVAMLLFVCTFSYGLIGQLGISAAPRLAASEHYGIGGGPAMAATMAPAATQAPIFPAAATQQPLGTQSADTAVQQLTNGTELPTATPEVSTMKAFVETPTLETRAVQSPGVALRPRSELVHPWPYLWLGLAVVLVLAALIVRWSSRRSFLRKHKSG